MITRPKRRPLTSSQRARGTTGVARLETARESEVPEPSIGRWWQLAMMALYRSSGLPSHRASAVLGGVPFTARSFLEPGSQQRVGGPVGDGDGFVGFELTDVAQHGERLAAGHEAQGGFEASQIGVGHGVAQRCQRG